MPCGRHLLVILLSLVVISGCGRFRFESGGGGGGDADAAPMDGRTADVAVDGSVVPVMPDYLWDVVAGGPEDDVGRGIGVASDGRVYVTGSYESPIDFGGGERPVDGATTTFLVALERDGLYRWDVTYATAGGDRGLAVATDSAGNVYLVGQFDGAVDFGGGVRTTSTTDRDAMIVALDAEGGYRWDRPLGGIGVDVALDIAVDGADNLYVVGIFNDTVDFGGGVRTSTLASDGFVVSYDPLGEYRWDYTFGGELSVHPAGVALGTGGSIHVAGDFFGPIDFGGGARAGNEDESMFVLTLGTDGAYRWDAVAVATGTSVSTAISAFDVTTDARGNVYVAGPFVGVVDFGGGMRVGNATNNTYVYALGPLGAHRWDAVFSGCAANTIASDAAGNLHVGGFLRDPVDFGGGVRMSSGGIDAFIFSLDADGAYRWDAIYGADRSEVVEDLAVDGAGRLLATGSFFSDTIDLGGGPRLRVGRDDIFVLAL